MHQKPGGEEARICASLLLTCSQTRTIGKTLIPRATSAAVDTATLPPITPLTTPHTNPAVPGARMMVEKAAAADCRTIRARLLTGATIVVRASGNVIERKTALIDPMPTQHRQRHPSVKTAGFPSTVGIPAVHVAGIAASAHPKSKRRTKSERQRVLSTRGKRSAKGRRRETVSGPRKAVAKRIGPRAALYTRRGTGYLRQASALRHPITLTTAGRAATARPLPGRILLP